MHEQKSMSLTFINKPSNSTIYPEYSLLDYKTLLEIQLDFLHDMDLTTQQMKKKKRTFKRWGIMEKLRIATVHSETTSNFLLRENIEVGP